MFSPSETSSLVGISQVRSGMLIIGVAVARIVHVVVLACSATI